MAEIRLYAIEEGRLPAAVAADAAEEPTYPRRHFANYWEDPAFIHDFAANGSTPESLSILIDRFAAYMKFCGQDVLAFPACFYGGRIGEGRYNPRDLPPGCLDAFYAKFDREGLFLVPTINQQRVPVAEGLVTRASMLDGSLHPSAIAIHSTGKPNWGGWHGTPPNFNIAHPDVQREFLRIVRDLAEEGKSHPSFKGVALHLAEVNPLWWGSIESGYNDYCIAAFEKASGIVVPVDRQDPLRGKAYAEWLKANAGDAWVAWRCRVLTDFYARLAKTLSDARSDLKLWVNAMPEWQPETVGFMEPGFREKRLREAGIDAAEIAKRIPNVVLGVTGYPAAWRRWMAWRCEEHRLSASVKDAAREWSVSPAHFAPVASAAAPWGHFHDVYWENPVGANRLGKDVLSNDWLEETRWRVSALHPSGHHALKGFAAALAGSDAQVLSCGGFLVGTLGMEPELAEFMRTFRSLPAVKFTDLPAPPGVVIRTAKCAGRIWRYELQTEHPYGLKVTSEKE